MSEFSLIDTYDDNPDNFDLGYSKGKYKVIGGLSDFPKWNSLWESGYPLNLQTPRLTDEVGAYYRKTGKFPALADFITVMVSGMNKERVANLRRGQTVEVTCQTIEGSLGLAGTRGFVFRDCQFDPL